MHHLAACQLAIEIRDLLLVRAPGHRFELFRDADRLLPVFFLLVDFQQELQRVLRVRGAFEPEEELLRAIEQPCLEVVLRELEERCAFLVFLQVRALDQVLVHADRALELPAAAKKAAEREMELHCLRIDFDHFDESLDRLVGLLVQQEIEPLEVRRRQRPRFRHELLDVDARGEPSQREKKRQGEQPPILEIHRFACALQANQVGRRRLAQRAARSLLAALELALERRDLPALSHDRAQRGQEPERRPETEEYEQHENQRSAPLVPEKVAHRHRVRVLHSERHEEQEQERSQYPQQIAHAIQDITQIAKKSGTVSRRAASRCE